MSNPYFAPRQPPMQEGYGSPHVESRLTQLELHVFYAQREREALAKSIDELHEEIAEIERDRAALIRKLGLWIISGLLTALAGVIMNLVLPALKGGFQPPG